MQIKALIRNVAKLVESREIIDHGTIRCLHDDNAVHGIQAAEGCDEVDTGTIGDDDLAAELLEIAEDGDRIADLDLGDLVKIEDNYRGETVADYVDEDSENELKRLDALIDAAREIV